MFGFGKRKKEEVDQEMMDKIIKPVINHFNEEAYLDANPDVKRGIRNGEFRDAHHHLEIFGFNEIEQGQRSFHKNFEPFNEESYLELFSEVKKAVDDGTFQSAFEHFANYGYEEILDGQKIWPGLRHQYIDIPIQYLDVKAHQNENTDALAAKVENNATDITIENFDMRNFLNMDLKRKDDVILANTYLSQIGYRNIISGKSKFHKDFEAFSQESYFQHCPDIEAEIINNKLKSKLDHFIYFGYQEIIKEERFWPKEEKGRDLEKLRFINYRRKIRGNKNEH